METLLGSISVVVGAATALLGFGVGRGREPREQSATGAWSVAVAAVLGTLLLFILTRPVDPPFSPGQRLGWGVLIGGLLGVLAGLWSTRMADESPWASGVSMAGFAGIALFGVGTIVLIFGTFPSMRVYPDPALGGFMIGALVSAVLFRLAIPAAKAMDVWALSSVALAGTALLALQRFDTISERNWWRAPLMVAVAAIVAQVVAAGTAGRGKGFARAGAIASFVTLLLVAIFAWKVFPNWRLFEVAGAGVVSYAVIAWLSGSSSFSMQAAAAGALVVVILSALAFRLMAGFGIGISMLAGWAILLAGLASISQTDKEHETRVHPAQAVLYAMFIGVGMLLLRLFLENNETVLRGVDIRAHYTFISVAIGAILPFILTSFFPRPSSLGVSWKISSAIAAGLFAAAAPLLVLFLWGFHAEPWFLVGTIVSEIFILMTCVNVSDSKARVYLESAVLVLVAQVSAVQLSDLVGQLTDETRAVKITVLGVAVLIGLIWAGISSFAARGVKEA